MNRVPRILTHPLPQALNHHLIQGDSAHYLLKVLRVKPGQPLELFDGAGQQMRATVSATDRRSLTLDCQDISQVDNRSPVHTTLCLALIKPERFEWALQKTCELGVDHIQPLICQRTDGRLTDKLDKKMARWQSILDSACEQSLRSHSPRLSAPIALEALELQGQGYVLDPEASEALQPSTQPIQLLIGPEGGWTQDEQRLIANKGYAGITLGPRILRAETAAVTALSLCQYLSGDLAG